MLTTTQCSSKPSRLELTHASSAIVAVDTIPTTPTVRVPINPETSAAQRAWICMFEASRILHRSHFEDRRKAQATLRVASASVDDMLPLVGGNYDFVQLHQWPSCVAYITSNIFEASQPYPVTKAPSRYRYECQCDGNRCIADNGTRLTSGCINAGMDLICDDTNCSVGADCGNRFRPQYHLDIISTRVGLGVVCSSSIPKGAFVVEYVGEMLLCDDAIQRLDQRYLVELKAEALWDGPVGLFIDAFACGNKSRFINHSCDPNCALYEWEWTNSVRLGIFATKNIPPLQELTFRYRENNLTLFKCQCNSDKCASKRAALS